MDAEVAGYRECAQAIVNQISPRWRDYIAPALNFWRIANAFTTLIDFFAITQQSGISLGNSVYDAFQDKNNPGWWYDDYGWWTVAFLQAARFSRYVGKDPATWRQLAQICWDEMQPATQVWAKADKQIFALAKPRFDGGCWNHDFVQVSCDPVNPPDFWPACGIQNTVTNAQYLVAAARFSRTADARRQYDWLSSWFFDSSLSLDQRLLVTYEGAGALVRERVSTFAMAPDGKYPPTPNYDKDRHWTGDQGILLGALLEMVSLDPPRRDEYWAMARSMLNAVRIRLVNGNQILQPWMPANSFDSSYATDYGTGAGVFMRYLLYLYLSGDPVLRPYISSTYRSFIQTNADAACQSIGNCPLLPDGSPMDPVECLLSQLAVLNAAVAILGPDPQLDHGDHA